MNPKLLNVHVFTDAPALLFIKQFPNMNAELGGFRFNFGLDVPEDADLLILFNRASYSVPTRLPVERTAFIAAEPEVIHPYSSRFLNQFGITLSATDKLLKTEQWRTSPCWYWYAGIDFSQPLCPDRLKGRDYFADLPVPEKSNKVVAVTSNKVNTPYHKQRVAFLDALIERIPEHLEIYGHGYKSIGDKADALLPCKYHIALENSGGPDTWTEKFADPVLCWSFPFYNGCTNLNDYFPADSFAQLDLENPDQVARDIVSAIENDHWQSALPAITKARDIVLSKQNIAAQLVELCKHMIAKEAKPATRNFIWSERSLWPERGARGSIPGWAFRNLVMAFDPKAELKTVGLRSKIETARGKKRQRKLAKLERAKENEPPRD